MEQVTIHGFAQSSYTQTALHVAAEAGVKTSLQPLEFHQPSHYALHPYGKMPVLEHGDVRLYETLAIIGYLDRVFGGGALQPTDPLSFARMLQWSSVAIDYAYPALIAGLLGEETGAEALSAAAEQLKLLDAGLGERPFFAGDALSLADFMLFPMVVHAAGRIGDSPLKRLSALRRWHEVVSDRPSVGEAA